MSEENEPKSPQHVTFSLPDLSPLQETEFSEEERPVVSPNVRGQSSSFHVGHNFDELIPTSQLFDHEVDLYDANLPAETGSTGSRRSFHNLASDERVAYTRAPTSSLVPTRDHVDSNVVDLNDADFQHIQITTTSSQHASTDTGSQPSAIEADTNDKTPFIPRFLLKAPDSLQIVQREYANGDLDGDIVAQRKSKAARDAKKAKRDGGVELSSSANTPVSHPNDPENPATPSNVDDSWLNKYRDLLRTGHKLNQWKATAICANDAVSSVLYMTGSVVQLAGVFAPICTLLIAILLFFFKNVYRVVTAIPANGGCYNILLNSTRKSFAAIAALLTVLSYIATAVVSGTEAIAYIRSVFDFPKNYLPLCVIGLLFVFAVLNWIGIGESANVALAIFAFHVTTLLVLIGFSIGRIISNGEARWDVLYRNWDAQSLLQPNVAKAIFHGFGAAALGCSGFESSSNFISEQRPGVFLKTIRNMHVFCSFFNILLPLCCIFHVDFAQRLETEHKFEAILSALALNLGGNVLQIVTCIDAACVLSGGVLTSYVGVTGLIVRLSLDRVIPDWFLKKNKLRRTYHVTIFGFFVLCSTMYLILNGDSHSLSSTYSVAFLLVMGLFAVGVMLIKINRTTLQTQRPTYWYSAIIGLVGVIVALAGIIAADPTIIVPFVIYFSIGIVLLAVMLNRISLLAAIAFVFENTFGKCIKGCSRGGKITTAIRKYRHKVLDHPMCFLTRCGQIDIINKAVLYIQANEDCCWIRLIHFFEDEDTVPVDLDRNVRILNEFYPKIRIDIILVNAPFNPTTFAYVSTKLDVPRNFMFISAPTANFKFKIEDFGGCRVIAR